MLPKIKNIEEIEKIKIASRLAAEVLQMIEHEIKEGVSTQQINDICHDYIVNKQKAIPATLNYKGFPASICTSLNDVVCHGVPKKKEILKNGDIINIDVTVIKEGYHGDTSKMFFVGDVNYENKRLCEITQQSLYEAIKIVKEGECISKIGKVIQKFVKKNCTNNRNYSIVREYCGHGIGKDFHEDPQVLHFANNDFMEMKAGMCFTIEPMLNIGKNKNTFVDKDDNWTVYTSSGGNSAQYEHTILVTKKGCEILTLRPEENFI